MSTGNVSVSLPAEITRDIVTAQIRAAVVASLASDPEKLVRAVVDAAMAQKVDNWRDRTIWDDQINQAIREAAQGALQEWITDNMTMIRKAVRTRLDKEKRGILEKLVDSIADAAKSSWCFSIAFKEIDGK